MADGNSKITLTIDGGEVAVAKGTLVIEAAKELGIEIPTFCYQRRLLPHGSCRMCLVEIEKFPKLEAACTTEAADGMIVRTQTEAVKKARRGMLEFLLINHPLDCPVCDSGGECDLQDHVVAYGPAKSRYEFAKRKVRKAYRMSPFVVEDSERCIHCARCIRFCDEIAGEPTLQFFERGAKSEVRTFEDEPFGSVFSGNTIDLCPVGALTSEVYRFRARPWDVKTFQTVCPHCACGCTLTGTLRDNRVVRFEPGEDEAANEGWICDKGRFCHHFTDSPERVTTPRLRHGGSLQECGWDEAIEFAAARLTEIKSQHGASAIGGIGGARCTNEDAFVLREFLANVIGTPNIDHRLSAHKGGVSANPMWSNFGAWSATNSLADIENADVILLVGDDPREEHPIAELRIRKAASRKGAKLIVVNPARIQLAKSAQMHIQCRRGAETSVLNGIAGAILEAGLADQEFITEHVEGLEDFKARLDSVADHAKVADVPERQLRDAAELLGNARGAISLFGNDFLVRSDDYSGVQACVNLCLVTGNLGRSGAGLLGLTEHNNTTGAATIGLLPEDGGKSTREMLEAAASGDLKALILVGADPVSHFPDAQLAEKALENLDLLVVLDLFENESARNAHVFLPCQTFAERTGHFTNCEGKAQGLSPGIVHKGSALPEWKILASLSKAMGTPLGYESEGEIAARITAFGERLPSHASLSSLGTGKYTLAIPQQPELPELTNDYPFELAIGKALFDNGTLVRQTKASVAVNPRCFAEINTTDAGELGISEGDMVRVTTASGSIEVEARLAKRMRPKTVFIPDGFPDAPANRLLSIDRPCEIVRIQKA